MKCKIPLGLESLAPNSVASVYVQSQSSKFRSHSTNLCFVERACLTKVTPSIITPNIEYVEVYQYSSQLKWFATKLNH